MKPSYCTNNVSKEHNFDGASNLLPKQANSNVREPLFPGEVCHLGKHTRPLWDWCALENRVAGSQGSPVNYITTQT
jgi:hypothetical protein